MPFIGCTIIAENNGKAGFSLDEKTTLIGVDIAAIGNAEEGILVRSQTEQKPQKSWLSPAAQLLAVVDIVRKWLGW